MRRRGAENLRRKEERVRRLGANVVERSCAQVERLEVALLAQPSSFPHRRRHSMSPAPSPSSPSSARPPLSALELPQKPEQRHQHYNSPNNKADDEAQPLLPKTFGVALHHLVDQACGRDGRIGIRQVGGEVVGLTLRKKEGGGGDERKRDVCVRVDPGEGGGDGVDLGTDEALRGLNRVSYGRG